MSLIFFAWNQPRYLWIILASIAVNYTATLAYDRFKCLADFVAGIIANLAFLFYYKYFDFALSSINDLFSNDIALRNIVLPIGTMFGIGLGKMQGFTIGWYVNRWVFLVMAIAAADICGLITNAFAKTPDIIRKIVLYAVFVFSIARVMSGTYNPFIYFQF